MQGELSFAIVDEVDSILIDEARTPLIISGPTDENSDLYIRINASSRSSPSRRKRTAPATSRVDEKAAQVLLTEDGHQRAEEMLERRACWRRARAFTTPPTSCSCTTSTPRCARTRCSRVT